MHTAGDPLPGLVWSCAHRYRLGPDCEIKRQFRDERWQIHVSRSVKELAAEVRAAASRLGRTSAGPRRSRSCAVIWGLQVMNCETLSSLRGPSGRSRWTRYLASRPRAACPTSSATRIRYWSRREQWKVASSVDVEGFHFPDLVPAGSTMSWPAIPGYRHRRTRWSAPALTRPRGCPVRGLTRYGWRGRSVRTHLV
jgi:hypothetical protein